MPIRRFARTPARPREGETERRRTWPARRANLLHGAAERRLTEAEDWKIRIPWSWRRRNQMIKRAGENSRQGHRAAKLRTAATFPGAQGHSLEGKVADPRALRKKKKKDSPAKRGRGEPQREGKGWARPSFGIGSFLRGSHRAGQARRWGGNSVSSRRHRPPSSPATLGTTQGTRTAAKVRGQVAAEKSESPLTREAIRLCCGGHSDESYWRAAAPALEIDHGTRPTAIVEGKPAGAKVILEGRGKQYASPHSQEGGSPTIDVHAREFSSVFSHRRPKGFVPWDHEESPTKAACRG